jgi:hypothetical protein
LAFLRGRYFRISVENQRRRGVSRKKEEAAAGGEETSRGERERGGATA